jgi:hypothetical protein
MKGTVKQQLFQVEYNTKDVHKSEMSGKPGILDFLLLLFHIQFIHLRKYDKINKEKDSCILMTYYY